MLARIVRWSLQRPRLVVWMALWVVILGALYVRDIKLDLLPTLAPAQADVDTEAPGLVAEQVEEAVTQPIESVLLGTPGVASVTSRSVQGLSVVTLHFAAGADPDRVRAEVTQNLGRVGTLPAGAGLPRLTAPIAPGPDLIRIGFSSARLGPMDLRDVVQWSVRPRLLSTPGVASVAIYGGQVRRIEVRARPGDLSDSDLGFLDIVRAARRATSIAGAGFIDTPNQRVLIAPHGQAETIDEVKDGQIQTPGADPVRIDDVADVSEEPAPSVGDALIDGKPAVIVVVGRALGANTVDATHAVERALAVLRPSLAAQGVAVRTDLDRPASFIVGSTERLMWDLGIGIVLVAVALAIFMRDARVVLVSLVSAPLTFLVTLAVLKAFGFDLDAMTLGGLAVALGLVIDDAVVDVESILSDLQDAESRHASRFEAILAASLEVRGPVVYAMLALALSLVPLLFLPGPERVLLAPLALAIIVAALVSLVVAMTVTPALALLFFRHVKPERTPAPIEWMKAWQGRWLARLEARSWPLLAGAAVLGLIAVVALVLFRSALLPTVDDGHLLVETDAPAATAPAVVRVIGAAEARDLAAIPGVRVVSQQIGRDPTADSSAGIQHSLFDIALAPGLGVAAQAAAARRVAQVLSGYPGVAPLIRSGLDRGEAGQSGAPSLHVAVSGQDLDAVDAAAAKVAAALAAMPGSPAVRAPDAARSPVVRVDLDFNRLALFGLSAADVLDTVQAAFAGETVARIYRGSRVENLVVLAQDSLRQDPEAVGDLLLRSTSTSALSVPLRSIANVYLTDARSVIEHGAGARRQTVTATPAGDIDRFADRAAAVLHKVTLPPGVFLDLTVSNSAAQARRNLALAYGLGLFAVFAFLTVAFDGRTAALILASTLLSFVGAAVAVALLGELTLGAMAGLVALLGLSMRNAILLIDRAETLALAPGGEWDLATVSRAAGERFVPVAASTLLAALALAPIAVQAGAAGMEVLGPMAIVIIAGLVTGAIGDVLVLPIALRRLWRPGLGARGRAVG